MKLLKLELLFLFVICCNHLKSQILDHLERGGVFPISSLNWQTPNIDEVKPFRELLTKYNLLVLAEVNHGDGASYDAQMMILKSLIDSGFISTIYTESNWMNIDKINEDLKTKGISAIRTSYKYMLTTELKYWADKGFWNYLANKIIDGKILLKGIDMDGSSELIVKDLYKEAVELKTVKDFLKNNRDDSDIVAGEFNIFGGWGLQSNYSQKSYMASKNVISVIIDAYRQSGNIYRVKQWTTLLNMFYWMYKRSIVLEKNKFINVIENEKQNSQFHSIRDSLMADIFLSDYHFGGKAKGVILLSAYHAVENSTSIAGVGDCCKDASVNIFGDMVNKKLGKEIYSICFITASGKRGVNDLFSAQRNFKISKPIKCSIEYKLKKLNYNYCFLDLGLPPFKNESFCMNALHNRFFNAVWSNNFSGLFFIKKMYPLDFTNISVLLKDNE